MGVLRFAQAERKIPGEKLKSSLSLGSIVPITPPHIIKKTSTTMNMDRPKRSKSKPARFNPSEGKTPEEERMPQVLNDLNEAPPGSEVMYFAMLDLSEEFLSAIEAKDNTNNIPNRTFLYLCSSIRGDKEWPVRNYREVPQKNE